MGRVLTFCFINKFTDTFDHRLVFHVKEDTALLTLDTVNVHVQFDGVCVVILFMEPIHSVSDDIQWNSH